MPVFTFDGELEEKQVNHWFALASTAFFQRLYVPATWHHRGMPCVKTCTRSSRDDSCTWHHRGYSLLAPWERVSFQLRIRLSYLVLLVLLFCFSHSYHFIFPYHCRMGCVLLHHLKSQILNCTVPAFSRCPLKQDQLGGLQFNGFDASHHGMHGP